MEALGFVLPYMVFAITMSLLGGLAGYVKGYEDARAILKARYEKQKDLT